MADVFISYARAVREPTLELAGRLWAEGYTTWTDTNLAADAIPFQQIIDAEVDQAKAVITIWSAPALKSRWVSYESNRAQKQSKLFCTHTSDVDPSGLPADFHGLNSLVVSDFASILNSLVKRGVRPEGVSEADLPEEAALERQALREWRDGMETTDDIAALKAFIARFERARMVRDVALWRLRGLEARAAARGDAERERVFKLFDAIRDSSDPELFDVFVRKHFTTHPELAAPAAQRLQELDPDLFLKSVQTLPGAGASLAEFIAHAERAIRLRETPPDAAILRLDPGMHVAVIKRISASADGRLLATASHDKTARLWALPEGPGEARLLGALRPPIGDSDEGKLSAVALDPAGRWAAVGGWTSKTGLDEHVSIFDVASGAVLARLGPLPNVITDLEMSRDGTRLAAGLGGAHGIRVWDVAPLSGAGGRAAINLAFEDRAYGDTVLGLAFAADGRLATTSFDGHVRLYAPGGALLAKQKAPGGEHPFGVAFAPEGARLAVGYHDTTVVDLFDGATLAPIAAADTAAISGGNLMSVAFLTDGRLAAGGMHASAQGDRPIAIWDAAGQRRLLAGAGDAIMDLAALPGLPGEAPGLAFAAGDPAFGVYASDGARRVFQGPTTADLREKNFAHFLVSSDGRRLRFGLQQASADPVLFDLARRRLAPAAAAPKDLKQADTTRLKITGWLNETAPILEAKAGLFARPARAPLPLRPHEIARSLAIAPDANSFVLGTEWRLRRFDAKGAQIWERQVPEVVWGLNLARNGRLILAAYGDGTLRWHRADNGEEMLALFLHVRTPAPPSGLRAEAGNSVAGIDWILFTPNGYFEASSPEAESLIGWHVNRGPDEAADFYPASTFASLFRRPDLIGKALDGV